MSSVRTIEAPGKVKAALLRSNSRNALRGGLLWAALHDGAPALHEACPGMAAAQRRWISAPLRKPCGAIYPLQTPCYPSCSPHSASGECLAMPA